MQNLQKLLLIRHAESLFNYTCSLATDKIDPYYDPELVDCNITKKGEEQAENARKEVESSPIAVVLVSPLQRALHTAKIIFGKHKDKPKFIVVPFLREKTAATCDISNFIDEPLEGYEDFDWSLMTGKYEGKNRYWLMEELKEIESLKKNEIKGNAEDQKMGLVKHIRNLFMNGEGELERVEDYKKSIDKFYDFLVDLKKNGGVDTGKYIAIVSHYENLKNFMKKLDGYEIECVKNCQIIEKNI